MDPVVIDPLKALASVAGIVALTIAIVQRVKMSFGDTPYMKEVPAWAYTVVVSGVLTYLSHSVLHAIEGDVKALLVQAILQALLASGAYEMLRAGNKPISQSTAAFDARFAKDRSKFGGDKLPVIILCALLLGASVACASRTTLIKVDAAVAVSLVGLQSEIDVLALPGSCGDRPCITPDKRKEIAAYLLPALEAAAAFNRNISNRTIVLSGERSDYLRLSFAIAELTGKLIEIVPIDRRGPVLTQAKVVSDHVFSVVKGVQ